MPAEDGEPFRWDSPNQQVVRPDADQVQADAEASLVDDADGSADDVEDDAYDPGDFTVADVEAYAAEHPDQVQAIVAAERAGKNRTTLLAALGAE